jgi:hypothetical protein
MTDENAPDPEAPSAPETPEPPQIPKRSRWPIFAGGIAIVLIASGASKGIGACTDPDYRGCVTDHLQHAFAILGTVTAALASVTQGKTAKRKSDYHKGRSTKGNDETLKGAHAYDANHFNMVSFWWYSFFVGALAAVFANSLTGGGSRSLTAC